MAIATEKNAQKEMKKEKKTKKKWCCLDPPTPYHPPPPDEAGLLHGRSGIRVLQPLLVPGHIVLDSGRQDGCCQAAIRIWGNR